MLTQIPQSSSAGKFICLNPNGMSPGTLYTVPPGKKLTADFIPYIGSSGMCTINGVSLIICQANATMFQTVSLTLPADTVIAVTSSGQYFTIIGYES